MGIINSIAESMPKESLNKDQNLQYLNSFIIVVDSIRNRFKLFQFQKMKNSKNSYLMERLKAKYSSFLLHEITPPPLLYFLIFAYIKYPLEPISASFNLFLFGVAVKILMVTNFNFVFMLPPFFNITPVSTLPMLAFTVFACNQKWKVHLFIFAVGNHIFAEATSNHYFMALYSAFICTEAYRTLIFRAISDNINYFVGMAVVFTYNSIKIVASSFNINENASIMTVLVLTAAAFSHSLITYRIHRLKKFGKTHTLLAREAAHYIKMQERNTNSPLRMQASMRDHAKTCHNLHCFCQKQDFKSKPQYLIRDLYESAVRKYQLSNDNLLFENYIDFLLENKQVLNALHFLSGWEARGYFSYIARSRSKAKIEKCLIKQNTSNLFEKQYTYALEYDQHSQYVAIEINGILKLKLQFWNQINKQCPRVIRIQELGYEIIDKMHGLNVFYNQNIKVFEQKLFVFDSTALYAMYMLSTTNFKEYAEIIIKNTAKLLQEVYIFENNASETFAIRTVVKNELKCFFDDPQEVLKDLSSQKASENSNRGHYKLMIDAVSSGLCKLLHLTKRQLIGNQLKTIIPAGYKEAHSSRLDHLLDFDSSSSAKTMAPSKAIHKQMKLPIKGANGQLVMGYINVKFFVDSESGFTFLSIVRLAHDKSSNILMEFSGNITEMQEGFNQEILKHSEVKKYLSKLRTTWAKDKTMNEEKFNIMINSTNYIIILSSPFLTLFPKNQLPANPPIHIEVINQQTTRNRTAQNDKLNKVGRQIMHMESAIHNCDASSSASSSRGGTSAANILTSFSENNTVQLYRLLYITFASIITCCIFSNITAFFVTELPWDSTAATNNPINDTMNFYALEMLTIKSVIAISDEFTYFQESSLNATRIAQYFGYQKYAESMARYTFDIEQAFKSSLFNLFTTPSKYLHEQVYNHLQTYVNISNVNGSGEAYQSVRYDQLLMLYASDFDLLTRLNLNGLIIAATYSSEIMSVQNASFLSNAIDRGVSTCQARSLAVHVSLMAFSAVLLIPLFCLFRKRLALHQKIFDLLASIDAGEVDKQIQSLEYISNVLRSYKQSNEIMKMNVLEYQQNLIHPKRRGSKSSVDNEMMLGLQIYNINHSNKEVTLQQPDIQSSALSRNSNESFQLKTVMKRRESERKSRNLGTLIKTTFMNTKQQSWQIRRKRAGQLNLEESMLDPDKGIITSHCIVYSISVSFLIFLLASLILSIHFSTQYLKLKNYLLDVYNEQILFEKNLLIIKVYLIYGGSLIRQSFNIDDQQAVVWPILKAAPVFDYDDGDTLYSQIISNCTNSSTVPNIFTEKYCQYDYSEVVLKGEFGALLKELSELRYAYDHNLSLPQTANQTLINIIQKIYYLESMNVELEQLVLNKVNLIFQSIVLLGNSYYDDKLLLLIVSVGWGLLCFLIGFAIQIRMKEGYFKEVFMITLLNNEMILTNKRVESFLQSIARNSYS